MTGLTLPLHQSQNVSLTNGSLHLAPRLQSYLDVSHNATLARVHEGHADLGLIHTTNDSPG